MRSRRLEILEERRSAYGDFLAGRIIVPSEVIHELLSSDGPSSVTALGYTGTNVAGLVRVIVWTSRWLWNSKRRRRTRDFDYYEIGTAIGTPAGEPRVPCSVIWKVDRRTKQMIVAACYVGEPGSRPELIPSPWPWCRVQ